MPAHDWFEPRLKTLLTQAEAAGFTQDLSVAVITDIINGPDFNNVALPSEPEWHG
jgi:hypothetical protein